MFYRTLNVPLFHKLYNQEIIKGKDRPQENFKTSYMKVFRILGKP